MSDEEGGGTPAWVMTFADLMSLLMCFFVLLLSFSEMDVMKFKQLAGSVKLAFGVQSELKVKDIPKGVNVIAKEFSPGKPEPTAMNEIRQKTSEKRPHLDINQGAEETKDQGEAQAESFHIRQELRKEIETGLLDVEAHDKFLIIRISERSSFRSASATLRKSFDTVLKSVVKVLNKMPGTVRIMGHSDDVPIENDRFQSNWELSAGRAAAVAQGLVKQGLNPFRAEINAHGDTRPLVPNTSETNRTINRRVEIVIVQGDTVDKSQKIHERYAKMLWQKKFKPINTESDLGLKYRGYGKKNISKEKRAVKTIPKRYTENKSRKITAPFLKTIS